MDKKFEIENYYWGTGRDTGAVIYRPVCESERSHIGIVIMHSDSNYYSFVPCPEFARRGFTALAANVSSQKIPLHIKIQEVGIYVDYLKNLPGIEKVLIMGHSGGATLMSCYQAVAENGAGIFQDEGRIYRMPDIKPLTPADGVMLLDSNWGNGVMNLISTDPMITDEKSTKNLDPKFDLFDPKNGFDPNGAHYSKEFAAEYNRAQEERFDRIRESILERLSALERGDADYEEDEPVIIPGGSQLGPNNRLFPQDISYLSHTQEEYPLIHADGSITTEVVYSRRPPKFPNSFTKSYSMGAETSTVHTYLSSSTVRSKGLRMTETEIEGIDWDSSYCCTPGNVKHISAPMLIMGMSGGYEFLASEVVYKNAVKSADRTIAFVEGATHNFEPEHETEEFPGQYGDTVALSFDFAARWIAERF